MREEVYDSYWRLAAERQLIFHRRAGGMPPPWTTDEVIAAKKLCNAYRASDRISQYLIRHVIYGEREYAPEDVFLRIVLFRLFSTQSTGNCSSRKPVGCAARPSTSSALATCSRAAARAPRFTPRRSSSQPPRSALTSWPHYGRCGGVSAEPYQSIRGPDAPRVPLRTDGARSSPR